MESWPRIGGHFSVPKYIIGIYLLSNGSLTSRVKSLLVQRTKWKFLKLSPSLDQSGKSKTLPLPTGMAEISIIHKDFKSAEEMVPIIFSI